MKINLDYKMPVLTSEQKKAGAKEMTNQEYTQNYIEFAVNQVYKDGLEGQKRRIWGRIQRKIDEALDQNKDEVELEKAESDFISDAFDKCKYPPQLAKFIAVLEVEIEKLSQ